MEPVKAFIGKKREKYLVVFLVKIPEEAKIVFEKAIKNCQVAVSTSSTDSTPNTVPVVFLKLYDDEHILIADNYFQKTRKNLEENPKISIAFWNTETAWEGFQIKGTSKIYTLGKEYEEAFNFVKLKKPKLNTKAAVLVKIEQIYTLKPGPDAGKRLA